MDVGADINDSYVISIDFGNAYGNITVDVVSRYATRSLILNMEEGQILWRWDEDFVKLYDTVTKEWKKHYYQKGQAFKGYNKNIIEDMYINEMETFINAIERKSKFPNSLDEDIEILKLLNKIEEK